MEIRRARPQELAAAGEISVAAYAPFTIEEDSYVERLRDAATRDGEAQVWVAVEDGAVLGTVTHCPLGSPWREVARDDEGEFRMLAVSPAVQGRGVGRALVEACERLAVADDARGMVLSTMPEMAAAHRLYERLGYRLAPERAFTPVPGVDLIVYTKEW